MGVEVVIERELALLVALQGESSWKGGGGHGDVHWKDVTSMWTEVSIEEIDKTRRQNLHTN